MKNNDGVEKNERRSEAWTPKEFSPKSLPKNEAFLHHYVVPWELVKEDDHFLNFKKKDEFFKRRF